MGFTGCSQQCCEGMPGSFRGTEEELQERGGREGEAAGEAGKGNGWTEEQSGELHISKPTAGNGHEAKCKNGTQV